MKQSAAGRDGGARPKDPEALYRGYAALVFQTVGRRLGGAPREDVEEIASGVWLKLFSENGRRLAGFSGRGGAGFATWLRAVARNAAVDHLRKKVHPTEPLERGSGEEDEDVPGRLPEDGLPCPFEELLSRERREIVRLALGQLPGRYRRVVRAWFYEGREAPEIADAMGIAKATVYVWVHRAVAKLRERL